MFLLLCLSYLSMVKAIINAQLVVACPLCMKQRQTGKISLDYISTVSILNSEEATLDCKHWDCSLLVYHGLEDNNVQFYLKAQCKVCKKSIKEHFYRRGYGTSCGFLNCACRKNRLGCAMKYSDDEAYPDSWVPFPKNYLNQETMSFNFLEKSKFANMRRIHNFLLGKNVGMEIFLRGAAGSRVFVSLARYASPYIIVQVATSLLWRFDADFFSTQVLTTDSHGRIALHYLLGYHRKTLISCKTEYPLLLNLITRILKFESFGFQQIKSLKEQKPCLKMLVKQKKIFLKKLDYDRLDEQI